MKFTKEFLMVIIAIILALIAFVIWRTFRAERIINLPTANIPVAQAPGPGDLDQGPSLGESPPVADDFDDAPIAANLATNLEIPWALDFLPDGKILFTERPGRVRLIDPPTGLSPEPILTIAEVAHQGEGGLLGLTVHPNFSQNQFVYVYYTYLNDGQLNNKVVRFQFINDALVNPTVIIENIPGGGNHDGGRIKFGPDGMLYITTGDAGISRLAQEVDSTAGKILRLNDDGSIPADNPFQNSPVYSYGHRNPQGLAWDSQGRLWATEHGSQARDEVNLIEPGKNYGWPNITGDQTAPGFVSPVIDSGAVTWAPGGAVFAGDIMYYTGLRGQSLYRFKLKSAGPEILFSRQFGRLRAVELGPDGFLYLLTSNRDGRGLPTTEDDQIIIINPEKL
ncbi:MAG TPA: PQQ-dependent sugar dehydrogenase [Patescibacteria group bacterium]